MSDLEHTTPDEQRLYWQTMAARALAERMPEAELRWLAHTHNAVFEVLNGERRYVLRLTRLSEGRVRPLASEMLWLRLLRDIAGLPAPYPVQAGALQDDAAAVYAALFEYMEGETRTTDTITVYDLNAVGEYLAMLHLFSETFDPPNGFERPTLDWDGLFGAQSPYDPGAGAAIFTPAQREVFAQVAERVRVAMDALGTSRENFGLIHGDLLLKNLLFNEEGTVAGLDWEYCGPGYFLYDLTPVLWQLRAYPEYPDYEDALWEGYVSRRYLPDEQRDLLESLIAGRHLASCRWLAVNQNHPSIGGAEQAAALIAERTAELTAFLDSGRLLRRGRVF